MSVTEKSIENFTRVTSVLYPFSGLSAIDPAVVARAADRGTRVHKICEAIVQGLGEFGIDEETRPYVDSFKAWFEKGVEIVAVEQRFWDTELLLTGQVDFIIRTDEGLAIVDLKTSSKVSKTWAAQGSAYAYLAKQVGYDITKIFFIHLSRTGKYPKIIEYPIDDSFFLSIFRVYKHFYQG